jgi:hypothetical protein
MVFLMEVGVTDPLLAVLVLVAGLIGVWDAPLVLVAHTCKF